jgi:G3E family GTPase
VTGYLGAGKTTLLNQLLAALRPAPIAVIVNELGAVGVDGALIEAEPGAVLEASDGCVCCALVDERLHYDATLSPENDEAAWWAIDELDDLPLFRPFADALPSLLEILSRAR